jgi:hypothetical protein
MAGLVCSAIVAFLCVQAPMGGDGLNIRLQDQGIYIADTIQTKDWTLSWGQSMERASPQLDGTMLGKACDGATCLPYWRKCSGDMAKCSYAVALSATYSVFFDITATSGDAQKRADDAIRIIADFKAGMAVPLAKLDHDGPGDTAPVLAPPR